MTSAVDAYVAAAHVAAIDRGSRHLAVLLHGLGGDHRQPLGLTPDALASTGVDVLAPDARAHGDTSITGPADRFGTPALAEDAIGLIEHVGRPDQRLVLVGISMGAAVALEVARRLRHRTAGAILIRPAFGPQPWPPHAAVYRTIARLLRTHGRAGIAEFRIAAEYRAVARVSPAAAASLLNQFTQPLAAERVVRLETVPGNVAADWDGRLALGAPVTVVGTRFDPTHPYEIAQLWHRRIGGSTLVDVPPRDTDPNGYTRALASIVNQQLTAWTARAPARIGATEEGVR